MIGAKKGITSTDKNHKHFLFENTPNSTSRHFFLDLSWMFKNWTADCCVHKPGWSSQCSNCEKSVCICSKATTSISDTPAANQARVQSISTQKYFHCLHFGFGNKFSNRGSDRWFLNPTVEKQRSHCWDLSSAARRESGWPSSAWPQALFWLCSSPQLLFIESLLIIAPVVYFYWAWEGEHLCCLVF